MVKTEYFSDAYAEFPAAAVPEGQLSLRVENLACARGLRVVFADLNFTLAGGGVLHVSGANGAGKTSLLRMICGLLAPAAGTVSLSAIFAVRRRATGHTMSLSGSCRWSEKHADPARNDFLRKPVLGVAKPARGGRFAWPCRSAQTGRPARGHAVGGAKAASGPDPSLGRAAPRVVAG